MSFFFGRGRARANTTDLAKQAKDHITKLDGPGGAAKVNTTYTGNAANDHVLTLQKLLQTEELAKVLSQMKLTLQGTHGMRPRCCYCHSTEGARADNRHRGRK